MARRILITRRDWMQHAGASLSGGVWTAPLSNMLDSPPQVVARAATNMDWASTQFAADLGYTRKVGMIWFAGLHTTSLGTISIKAGTDASFVSNNYAASTTTWPQDSVAGEYNAWEEWTLNGVYFKDEYEKLGFPRVFIPPAAIDCRYIKVEIHDSTATAPLEIGCFGASEVLEPSKNFSYGWSLTPIDESGIERVPGGSTYFDPRGTRRRLNLGLSLLPDSEVWARAFGLSLVKGRSEPLWIVPFSDADEAPRWEKSAVYGLVSDDSPLSNPYFQRYALPVQIDQLY